MTVKAKKIWELKDYEGDFPSEDDIIPVIDVNGDADRSSDWDGKFDKAVTRQLNFGKVKEQMTLMTAKAICRVVGTGLESFTGYTPEPEPAPEPNPEPEETGDEEITPKRAMRGGEAAAGETPDAEADEQDEQQEPKPENGMAYILNHFYEYVNHHILDLDKGYEDMYYNTIHNELALSVENGKRVASQSVIQRLFNNYCKLPFFDTTAETLADAVEQLDPTPFSFLRFTMVRSMGAVSVLPEDPYADIVLEDDQAKYILPYAGTREDGTSAGTTSGRGKHVRSFNSGDWLERRLAYPAEYLDDVDPTTPAGTAYRTVADVQWNGFNPLDVKFDIFEGGAFSKDVSSFKKIYLRELTPNSLAEYPVKWCGVDAQGESLYDMSKIPGAKDPVEPWGKYTTQFYTSRDEWDTLWKKYYADYKATGPTPPESFPAWSEDACPAMLTDPDAYHTNIDGMTFLLWIKVGTDDPTVPANVAWTLENPSFDLSDLGYEPSGVLMSYSRAIKNLESGEWMFYCEDSGEIVPIKEYYVSTTNKVTVQFTGDAPEPMYYCAEYTSMVPLRDVVDLTDKTEVTFGDLASDLYDRTVLGKIRNIKWTESEGTWIPEISYNCRTKAWVINSDLQLFKDAVMEYGGTDGSENPFTITMYTFDPRITEFAIDSDFISGYIRDNLTGSQLATLIGNFSNRLFNGNKTAAEFSINEPAPAGTEVQTDNATVSADTSADQEPVQDEPVVPPVNNDDMR